MSNPWEEKNRKFWREDEDYLSFQKNLYNNKLSFEEALNMTKISEYDYKKDFSVIKKDMEEKWLKYIKEWNRLENIKDETKIFGFAALVFLYLVLPYDDICCVGKYFTHFEASAINVAYFYNESENLNFVDMEDLLNGLWFPGAYREWLDEKYNRASWWIVYRVYEKLNNLAPVIDSDPAEFVNKK